MKMQARSLVDGLVNGTPRIVGSPLITATTWLFMFLCGGTLTCMLVLAGVLFRNGNGSVAGRSAQ